MYWTERDLKRLDSAIATGTLFVRFDDKEVAYRSLEEMLKLRSLIIDGLSSPYGLKDKVFVPCY
jgi:hypothetical protein